MSLDQSFRKYYQTDRYKGFHKVKEQFNSTSRITFMVFSNGKKQIYVSGMYTEDAMFKAFQAIDQYHAKNKCMNRKFIEV